MRPNPTNRPTFADLAQMLADEAQEYGTRRHDGGSLNDEETAAELISILGGLTEDLADFDLSERQINALMDVTVQLNRHAQTDEQQKTAAAAYEAIKRIMYLWGVIREYRPNLWQFTNAAARYERERCTAIAAERHADSRNPGRQPTTPRQTADNTPEQ